MIFRCAGPWDANLADLSRILPSLMNYAIRLVALWRPIPRILQTFDHALFLHLFNRWDVLRWNVHGLLHNHVAVSLMINLGLVWHVLRVPEMDVRSVGFKAMARWLLSLIGIDRKCGWNRVTI